MKTIKSPEELRRLRNEIQGRMHHKGEGTGSKVLIRVHSGTSGLASGANEIFDFITLELEKRNIEADVIRTGDMGYCFAEPTIEVTLPDKKPVIFGYVDKLKADEIIEKYIKGGGLVEGILPVNYQIIEQTK
jgi:NADP-reducing hydrogenase subunit HndB